MKKVRFNTAPYEWSTGHKPRGFGGWWFKFGDAEPEAAPGPMHYGTARQWAVLEARRRGVAEVRVCP